MARGKAFGAWLALAALVAGADQIAKHFIVAHSPPQGSLTVTGFFNLVRAHNSGAAFSFLAGSGGWQRWLFVALALVAAIVIAWLLGRHAGQKLFACSLALILGGAVGNVADRLLRGYVVDFLDFHWRWLAPLFHGGHFPAFNLADAAITAGVIGLLLDELRRVRRGG
jgi:signal peptidase II